LMTRISFKIIKPRGRMGLVSFSFFVVLEIKFRASHMLGKSTLPLESDLYPFCFIFCFWDRVSPTFAQASLNLKFLLPPPPMSIWDYRQGPSLLVRFFNYIVAWWQVYERALYYLFSFCMLEELIQSFCWCFETRSHYEA
jgi:hypothetical protein